MFFVRGCGFVLNNQQVEGGEKMPKENYFAKSNHSDVVELFKKNKLGPMPRPYQTDDDFPFFKKEPQKKKKRLRDWMGQVFLK